MLSEKVQSLEASSLLAPSLDGEASLQSAKYFPDTPATAGCTAT
jgi:hypothetical protein